ncbi:MarR family winged helix-turn-helix transcriptional regulator [Wohlfahrtiimonas larvae]|uniref:MarR family transcriptional regulator n=1 Tax=Wohlfahrtiimonas larvae TaxID=1157986 RepID=A0ABP9MB41_9GAMM|nr:MarR family transcriptional regulator [Wohlfahrtiimonas larvae]
MSFDNDRIAHAIHLWRAQKPDLAVDEMLMIGRLINCSIQAFNHLDALYESYGINRGEFDVLATIRRNGAPYQLSPTQIFSSLMISSGTMTNRLQQLEKKGLINRCNHPEDARSSLVALSDDGLKLINQLIYDHVELEKQMNELISPEVRQAITDGLGEWLEKLSTFSPKSSI